MAHIARPPRNASPSSHSTVPWNKSAAATAIAVASVLPIAVLTGCGTGTHSPTAVWPVDTSRVMRAVAAEDQYASVISQIGGKYVSVKAIMSNPNTDPHTYEASPIDAAFISQAQLVVQNGLGYDGFMNKLEAASPSARRKVIDVAQSLGYGPDTKNPHLWYNPNTMSRVAVLIEQSLAQAEPAQAAYFKQNLQTFQMSMTAMNKTVQVVRQAGHHAAVAVTEPVADYLLQDAGMKIETPWTFQAAVMNGVDPSPQDVQTVDNLITQHKVKVLVYNEQALDTVTTGLLNLARANGVPVEGVYETMPPGDTYQGWMRSELQGLLNAIQKAR